MFANRTKEISPFVVMQLLQRAEEYERSGKTVVHLEVGEPDFQTAEPIVKAAHSAIDAGRRGPCCMDRGTFSRRG